MCDLVDQPRAHLAVGAIDARRARLARLGDHLPRTRLEVAPDLFDPHVGRHDEVHVLAADLGEHGEVARQAFDQLALDLRLDRDRAVGDLDVAQAQLREPRHQALHPTLADRELGQRAAEHDGDPVGRVAIELGAQVGRDQRRAPAQLDDVDAAARDLEQVVDLGHRQAPIDHVRQPPLARLRRARRDVKESGYGTVEALSRPTITATVAEPESDATVPSIGCGWATPSARATLAASARCPPLYSTAVTWFEPGGRPASALAREKPL